MTLVPVDYIAQTTGGVALSGASVAVRLGHTEGAGSLADIYSDAAGSSPLSNPTTTAADGTLLFYAEPGRYNLVAAGAANGVLLNVTSPVFRYATIAAMGAAKNLTDGDEVIVSAGANGQPETFTYDAGSTLTADGALIVTATGMGVGRLISKRTVYATVAEMLADNRSFDAGAQQTAVDVLYEAVDSGDQIENAAGQGFIIKSHRDYYSPSMFGAVPGTMTDYKTKIQECFAAAYADKRMVLVDGLYRTEPGLLMPHSGLIVRGADKMQCGFYPTVESTDDTLTVTGSGSQIDNLSLNSWGGSVALAVRGASGVTISNNVFLDRTKKAGTAIALDTRRPGQVEEQPGAYGHKIYGNSMYQGDLLFDKSIESRGLTTTSPGGKAPIAMNNCRIYNNDMTGESDVVYLHMGGGNSFFFNYYRSSSPDTVAGSRVGNGISSLNGLQFVYGGYFEKLSNMLFDRSATRWVGVVHNDNNDNVYGFSTGSKSPPWLVGDGGIQSLAIESQEGDTGQNYNLTGNGQALPVRSRLRVSGNGAIRTGCTLSTVGARDGQLMWLEGTSWPFELIESTTADFGQDAGVNMWFGSDGTTVSGLGNSRTGYERALFMYSNAKWRLLYVQRKAPTSGNFKQHVAAGSGETVDVGGVRTIYLNANGANRDNNTLTAPITDGQRLTLIGSGYRYQILHSPLVKLAGGANANVGTAASQLYTLELVGRAGVWYEVSRAAV